MAMRGPLRDRQFLRFGAYVATLTFAISFMGQFVTLYLRAATFAPFFPGRTPEFADGKQVTQPTSP